MLGPEEISNIIREYDEKRVRIGAIASHSALDVFDGAIEEGFRTVAVCQRGREATYARYFRALRDGKGRLLRGVVDDVLILDRFSQLLDETNQEALRSTSTLFVPNRALTSYLSIEDVEDRLRLPLLGSRNLLASEERGRGRDYYWILERAGLPFPERVEDPRNIDRLVIVKLHHAVKKLERGFFTAASYDEYRKKSEQLVSQGVITREDLAGARIERYIIGPVFNLDFFYSPIEDKMERIELLGVDWRFESSLDGHVRLPAPQQLTLGEDQRNPEYTVCGHNSATLRESLLEKAFALAEKYVKATQEHYPPGIIGPFCLQTCVDKDLNFWIYDVAPRTGGGTNIHMWLGHPYGNALWRMPMSTGRRWAREVKRAIETGQLNKIVT
ncbi:MAG: formate--phosphoribosylaminoimidazolecarboxamide ligase family protein [Thermoplasmata archaeon]